MRVNGVMDDQWRVWIAQNLTSGCSTESLMAAMLAEGVEPLEAFREIELAKSSPYLRGWELAAQTYKSRFDKISWIFEIQRQLNRQNDKSTVIERRHKLSREEFYQEYYFLNRPVIITGVMDDWAALSKWNFNYFKENFGSRVVNIQSGRNSNPIYEIEQTTLRVDTTFLDLIERIENADVSNDFYMTANNTSKNREALAELWSDIGRIPDYLDENSQADGFLWIGPTGTRTPFHHDLTNNFLAQVMGQKRIELIHPCEFHNVYNHLHCYSRIGAPPIDFQQYPLMQGVPISVCELNPGEMLFLPVGWWHYVEGISPSVTMTFINSLPPNNAAEYYSSYGPI
jgi:ribosomal protein L16 Arg81 hydroxylase